MSLHIHYTCLHANIHSFLPKIYNLQLRNYTYKQTYTRTYINAYMHIHTNMHTSITTSVAMYMHMHSTVHLCILNYHTYKQIAARNTMCVKSSQTLLLAR